MRPHNPYICLLVVGLIGAIAILGTGGIMVASMYQRDVPQALVAIVSTCLGSLASFLVSLPRGTAGLGAANGAVTPQKAA